jgi:hypothetical protein
VKIRRVQHSISLKNVPVDGVDMFLLSLLEDEIELSELTEIAPQNSLECLRRVLRLGRLGLLRVHFDSLSERLLAQGCDEAAAQELLDNACTLRPPPMKVEERASGRAPVAARVPIGALEDEPTTGIRRRPTPAEGTPVNTGKAAS